MLTPAVTDVLQAQGITPEVANATVKLACGILTKGCGEKVRANGCQLVVVNDPDRQLKRLGPVNSPYRPAELANPPWFNKYGGDPKPNVVEPDGAAMRFFQPDFVATGGFIGVGGQTGDVVVSRAVVEERMRAPAGTYDGVEIASLDDREALAMAARGGCLAMTCPAENCEISGASGGAFRVFYQAGGGGAEARLTGMRMVEVPRCRRWGPGVEVGLGWEREVEGRRRRRRKRSCMPSRTRPSLSWAWCITRRASCPRA